MIWAALGWLAGARSVSTALVVAAALQLPSAPLVGAARRREIARDVATRPS